MINEQILSSVVRIFSEDKSYGDKYDYVWLLLYHSIYEVEIIGVIIPPTMDQIRQLISFLREKQIEVIISNRRGRIIRHNLRKKNK